MTSDKVLDWLSCQRTTARSTPPRRMRALMIAASVLADLMQANHPCGRKMIFPIAQEFQFLLARS